MFDIDICLYSKNPEKFTFGYRTCHKSTIVKK